MLLKKQTESEWNLFEILIADVINMFGLEGVCGSIKSPLAPLF